MQFSENGMLLQAIFSALLMFTSAQGAELRSPGDPKDQAGAPVASFDCTHAKSSREQIVCGDPVLSGLDGQLGRIYRERKALLSLSGAKLLQDSQQRWLRFTETVCASTTSANDSRSDPRVCLKRQYGDRIRQLKTVAQRVGPLVFNRIDFYNAEPATDETGWWTGFYTQHLAYPQIDNAKSPELVAWNRQNTFSTTTQSGCDSPVGDEDMDYEVGDANARFISMEWVHSTYCHGAAHGFFYGKAENTVLSPHPRPLSERDVFGPGDAWVAKLKEQFWTTLIQTGWRPPENQSSEDIKQELEDDAIRPNEWLFTKEGLRISFSAYEGGCYACTPQPVTMPWAALKPLLTRNAIVP